MIFKMPPHWRGGALAIVPLLLDSGRTVRANVSRDADMLNAVDEAEKVHELAPWIFLGSAAREKIEERVRPREMPIDARLGAQTAR